MPATFHENIFSANEFKQTPTRQKALVLGLREMVDLYF